MTDVDVSDQAIARVANRLSAAYIMRTALLSAACSAGDLTLLLILYAIISANVDYLDHPLHNGTQFHGVDHDVPDELRRPVSVLALSNSLGLAYETTRRYVIKLIKLDYCIKVRGGVIVTSAALNSSQDHELMLQTLANLRRLYRDLRRFNVPLD